MYTVHCMVCVVSLEIEDDIERNEMIRQWIKTSHTLHIWTMNGMTAVCVIFYRFDCTNDEQPNNQRFTVFDLTME